MDFEAVESAATYIKTRTEREHSVALVLGSGLGSYADQLPEPIVIPFEKIPGFALPKVEGHGGRVVSTLIGGSGALVFFRTRPLLRGLVDRPGGPWGPECRPGGL